MEKLPISIGILGWNSNNSSLPNTLFSYLRNGFLDMSDDITIFFQELKEEDKKLAEYFNIKYIGADKNVGIAKAFHALVSNAKYDKVLILEHDWYLQENKETTYKRLKSSLELIDEGFDSVKMRSMSKPGFTDFVVIRYYDNPLEFFDSEIGLPYPHLLDTCHIYKDIHKSFPNEINQIFKEDCMFYTTTSRYGNYTNNPCIYKTQFYKDILEQFMCDSDQLEGKVHGWWARQNFKVAHSEGLFTHFDIVKYAPYWETINHFVREKNIM